MNLIRVFINQKIIVLSFTFITIMANGYANTTFIDAMSNIEIISINPVVIENWKNFQASDEAMYQACNSWQLDKEQVKQFFQLSDHYESNPSHEYYQIPCKITGELKSEGKIWQFTIDGGATGKWQNQQQEKYFGCRKFACESLVLMPVDDMNPDN